MIDLIGTFTVEAHLHEKYTIPQARSYVESLSAGEIDILRQCADALGWPSVWTLAWKYFQHLPDRKAWLYALKKTQARAKRVNVVYLVKAVLSIIREKLLRNFWSQSINVPHSTLNKEVSNQGTSRLSPQTPSPAILENNRRTTLPWALKAHAEATC